MAEAIGLASGLLTLAAFAFQSSVSLYDTVRSFQSHTQRVQDLSQELKALTDVLNPLYDTIRDARDVDLASLDLPLLTCGRACKEFEQELLGCASRSGGTRTSFRGWAKLRYLSGDVDEFRRLLASYKLTISVALTGANLRQSSITIEQVKSCQDLITTAAGSLQERLDDIDAKLKTVFASTAATVSEADTASMTLLEKEQQSTERCIQICRQLSDKISQLQLTAKHEHGSESVCGQVTFKGLQSCKTALASTASELEEYMQTIMDRMIEKSQTVTTSAEDTAELQRLRAEWDTIRRGRELCFQTSENLFGNVSSIENYAVGDATQYMVSTNGQVIHGTNKGLGWRSRQVGGHLSEDALIKLSDNMTTSVAEQFSIRESARSGPEAKEPNSPFNDRHGRGISLASTSVKSEAPKAVNSGKSV